MESLGDESPQDPRAVFGSMDIYLFDQLLRGRIFGGMQIFDAGCGGGRNLAYFLRAGYDVEGVDTDLGAIESVRELAGRLAPGLPPDAFRVGRVEDAGAAGPRADVVICNAVLHFARDDEHFRAMLEGAFAALRSGGLFFARLATSIGIESRLEPEGEKPRRFRLPDGSSRYLADERQLLNFTAALGGELLDPIKTTNVQNLRCMTTWVLRKAGG